MKTDSLRPLFHPSITLLSEPLPSTFHPATPIPTTLHQSTHALSTHITTHYYTPTTSTHPPFRAFLLEGYMICVVGPAEKRGGEIALRRSSSPRTMFSP